MLPLDDLLESHSRVLDAFPARGVIDLDGLCLQVGLPTPQVLAAVEQSVRESVGRELARSEVAPKNP